jgi:hypothetical protein
MPLPQAAPLRFDVSMEAAVAGHRARIVVTPGGHDRELVASNCEELADSVSIAVALALGSTLAAPSEDSMRPAPGTEVQRQPELPEDGPATAAGAVGAREKDDSELDASLEGSASWPAHSLSIRLLADAGSLPAPAVGAGLGAGAAWRRFELHVLATVLFEQQTQVESSALAGAGAKLQLWTGSALGCTLPWGRGRTALTWSGCLGFEAGRLEGGGVGVSEPRRGSAVWLAPLVQLGASWAIPDTALRLELALLGAAPLNRDEFKLRELGTVHQPNPWIGRLSLGVGVDL